MIVLLTPLLMTSVICWVHLIKCLAIPGCSRLGSSFSHFKYFKHETAAIMWLSAASTHANCKRRSSNLLPWTWQALNCVSTATQWLSVFHGRLQSHHLMVMRFWTGVHYPLAKCRDALCWKTDQNEWSRQLELYMGSTLLMTSSELQCSL